MDWCSDVARDIICSGIFADSSPSLEPSREFQASPWLALHCYWKHGGVTPNPLAHVNVTATHQPSCCCCTVLIRMPYQGQTLDNTSCRLKHLPRCPPPHPGPSESAVLPHPFEFVQVSHGILDRLADIIAVQEQRSLAVLNLHNNMAQTQPLFMCSCCLSVAAAPSACRSPCSARCFVSLTPQPPATASTASRTVVIAAVQSE